MPIDVGEYYAHPAFDPGVMAARGWMIERHSMWFQTTEKPYQPGAMPAVFEPAVPAIINREPSPALYATDMWSVSSDWYGNSRLDTQLLWDALGLQYLQRSPALSPFWADLLNRSSGDWVSSGVWSDFKRSSDWPSVNLYMRVAARRGLGQARDALTRMLARAGKGVVWALGQLLKAPTPTPAGVAWYIVKAVGEDIALDYASRGAKALFDYFKKRPDTPPTPPPLPGPWPPTGPVETQMFERAGYRGMRLPTPLQEPQFAAYIADAPNTGAPFVVRTSGSEAQPSHLMNLGQGLYR